MKKFYAAVVCCLGILLLSANVYSEASIEELSPELRLLLKEEMGAIELGMQNIVTAYIAGNIEEVAEIAGQIQKSYILKQKITQSQKHELHTKLSKTFIAKDQKFHEYAGMLAHVSQENHMELVSFYYLKLLESCLGCHSEHATHRFPSLSGASINDEHKH